MLNPSENLGHSEEKAPISAKAGPETVSGKEEEVHTKFKEHQSDNVEFLSATEKMSAQEKKEMLEKAQKWQTAGDLDLLRAAGLSIDQIKQNPLDRHVRLSSMFLTREQSTSQLQFKVDFGTNEQAMWDLDLSGILPPNILKVDIVDANGKILFADAVRGFKDGQPGYFTSKSEHASIQSGWKIRVKETQSSLAIKDQKQGKQTYENAFKEELYQVDNSRKTALKEEVRTQAAKENKEVVTDKNFFDKILTDLMKSVSPAFGEEFQKDGKVDFSKFLDKILATVFGIGVVKDAVTSSPVVQTPKSGETSYFDQSKQEKVSKATDKFQSKIDEKWLMENVARNNDEVQKFMVSINFMGANMRVNKLIAPYLLEAQHRIKEQGINFSCNQGDCGCQNWRPVRGGTSQSMHSWGTAIDLNVRENPWQPHLKGNNHGGKMISNMPPEVVNIMKDVGFKWGGDWMGPADPMHFQMMANPYASQFVLKSEEARAAAAKYLN